MLYGGGDAAFIWLVIFILAIVANFMAIGMLVDVANNKGLTDKNGKLWFIGLFTTPIVLGIVVCALPNNNASTPTATPSSTPQLPSNQLPEV